METLRSQAHAFQRYCHRGPFQHVVEGNHGFLWRINDLLLLGNGTHSFRKGVATFVAGCVAGLSAISIFLRAGWSLGVVTSRRIFTGQGGDQVICLEYCLLLFDLSYVLQHPIYIFDASRAIFNVSFLGLAKQCYNNDADTIMDQRRLGDITYLTFYDEIICDKKRKASSVDN